MDDASLALPISQTCHQNDDQYKEVKTDSRKADIITKYKKLGSAGIEGILFQINLLTLFALNSMEKKDDWRLSTENMDADKFDDIIFETSGEAILLQAKHKSKSGKRVTVDDLFSTNSRKDEFSLPKYFFSYQHIKNSFKIRNIIICTNATLNAQDIVNKSKKMPTENMLHFEGVGNVCNTFEEYVVTRLQEHIILYYKKYLQRQNSTLADVSYASVKDFLDHLQFIDRYPRGVQLEEIIEGKISQLKFGNNIHPKIARKFIHGRILEWYRQKYGIYLNYKITTAMFSELISNNYQETLDQYKVYFDNNTGLLHSNKKVLHICVESDIFMYILKAHRELQQEQALFLNPEDDINTQCLIIDSFLLPQYTHLVINFNKKLRQNMSIFPKIKTVLTNVGDKKIVIISEKNDKVTKFLMTLRRDNYETTRCDIKFMDLSEGTRRRLLEKTIILQGSNITLNELLVNAGTEHLNRILNLDVISQLLRNQRVEIGVPLSPFNENVHNYYITRNFHRDHQDISEEEMCLIKERIILISDTAGMGKSTVLTSLAYFIKRNNPHLWVFLIDLNSCTKYLRSIGSTNTHPINLLRYFNSQDGCRVNTCFEENLFSLQGRFVVLFDGVDEISPHFTNMVIGLISKCVQEANFEKVFVTTRPHLRDLLEESLEVSAFTLKPFSGRNQINFLRRYWKRELDLQGKTAKKKCKIYARALVSSMAKWIKNKTRNIFAGIPLQTRMLAETFQERHLPSDTGNLDIWESCQQYLRSKRRKFPNLPKTINLLELYQMFIQKKREIFIRGKGNPTGNVLADAAVSQKFGDCYNRHYSLALNEILDKEDCELFSCYNTSRDLMNDDELFMVGLVQKSGKDIRFVHRSFAEYLVAECLLNELKGTQSKQFQYLFLDKLLNLGEFTVVRAFFDNLLLKELDSIPISTYKSFHDINYNSLRNGNVPFNKSVKVFLVTYGKKSTFLHTLSSEGRANILRFFFKSFDSRNKSTLAKLFKRKKIDLDIENSSGETVLHMAIMGGHADVVKLLADRRADINKDVNGVTPLRMALGRKLDDVTKVLLQHGADVNGKSITGSSPLLISAFHNNLNLVRLILEEGINVDVNIRNHLGLTPLLLATRCNNLNMVRLLVEHGADVNAQDDRLPAADYQKWVLNSEERHFTALHVASQRCNLAMVKYLAENGADVDIQSSTGRTALHVAVNTQHIQLIEFLARRCNNLNVQDKFGNTPVHEAALSGNMEAYSLLMSLGVDSDIKDEAGNTPFDYILKFQNNNNELGIDSNFSP